MRLTIDNFDGMGPREATGWLASEPRPTIERRLNRPSQLKMTLLGVGDAVAPTAGARVLLMHDDGTSLFTGYVAASPEALFAGSSESGPVYRYAVTALSDEFLLDRKPVPVRPAFVARTAGAIVNEMTTELLPGAFDTTGVMETSTVPYYASSCEKMWSEHIAELGVYARASYRALNSALYFAPVGSIEYCLDEQDPGFSPESLKVSSLANLGKLKSGATPGPVLMNDVTIIGRSEPAAYVKDYFQGDGYGLSFMLSNSPFTRYSSTFVDEEFKGSALNANLWKVAGNTGAATVGGGRLVIAGGPVTVASAEDIELGGAVVLQHGQCEFTAPSSGLIGGLYSGGTDQAHAVAAFLVVPSGGQSQIWPVVNGAVAGGVITTNAGWRYVLSTRIYASEIYRYRQTYHSSANPTGPQRGGDAVAANVHFVLEVHQIDPSNPATLAAAATVLYDGVIGNAPASCDYLLVNAASMACTVAFARFYTNVDVEVTSVVPGLAGRTRLVGSLSDGGECSVSSTPSLYFYTPYVPVPGEAIRASYRTSDTAMMRVTDPNSIAAQARAGDDGVRAGVRRVTMPPARTAIDCENAALALLDDSTQTAWTGEYQCASEFLPSGVPDVWPGDELHVLAPSRGLDFRAIVREVKIELDDPANDRSQYHVTFANDAAAPMAFTCAAAASGQAQTAAQMGQPVETTATAGTLYIADLPNAELTGLTSTTVTLDAGCAPPAGGGIEVRRSDSGWGMDNDRNLAGRFGTQSVTLPRLSRTQSYYLRQYDSGGRYSRYTTELHVDYPL